MLNYDVTGHISFNKGCYTGQEVVARMHYQGKPKRRLYRARISLRRIRRATRFPMPAIPCTLVDTERQAGQVDQLRQRPRGDSWWPLVTATPRGYEKRSCTWPAPPAQTS